MILAPDESIGSIGVRVVDFFYAEFVASNQGRNGGRVNGDADAVETELVGIYHMGDAAPDNGLLPGAQEPLVDLALPGFPGRSCSGVIESPGRAASG